jgi:hypothetical protein
MPAHFAGLDLGQASDPTALSIVEQNEGPDPDQPDNTIRHYAVRYLKRWHLGTGFPAILDDVADVFGQERLTGCTLCLDGTGVGRNIVDLFRRAKLPSKVVPITITVGGKATPDAGGYTVPKKDLVGAVQLLLQSRRLQIAPQLPEAVTLVKELENFRAKVPPAGTETLESWREGQHDDLVFAVAMACWYAERPRHVGGLLILNAGQPIPWRPIWRHCFGRW